MVFLHAMHLNTPFLNLHAAASSRVSMPVICKAPTEMRLKELKAELDERGVPWRGVAFEKDELVRLLDEARLAPPSPPMPPSPAPSSPPPPAAASSGEPSPLDRMDV